MRDSLRTIVGNIKTVFLIVATAGTIVSGTYAYAVMTVDEATTKEASIVEQPIQELAQAAPEPLPEAPVNQPPVSSPAPELPRTLEPAPVSQPAIPQAYQVVQTVNGTFLIPIGAAVPWSADFQPEMEDEG